jgi:hypothetical protein
MRLKTRTCTRLLAQPHNGLGAPRARPRAPSSAHPLGGGSPPRAYALRPVTKGNCVAARRGGEQPAVNDQSVAVRTRFGRTLTASLRGKDEARPRTRGALVTLRGSVVQARTRGRQVVGDGMVSTGVCVTKGDLPVGVKAGVHALESRRAARAGVRGSVRATKHRNGCGAKGPRKVEA